MTRVRIWDLPTRLFHGLLALCVAALVVTAKVGGNWMAWHLWLGHAVLALLLFRLVWGVLGGHWSRWTRFFFRPSAVRAYWRGDAPADHRAGHSPLGALAVLAMLGALSVQVASGLMSDDEIAFFGPLVRFVSGDTVSAATAFHKNIGQYLVLGLIALHLLAIAFYQWWRRLALVGAMLTGDKALAEPVPPSRDDTRSRVLGLLLAGACAGVAVWVARLGSV